MHSSSLLLHRASSQAACARAAHVPILHPDDGLDQFRQLGLPSWCGHQYLIVAEWVVLKDLEHVVEIGRMPWALVAVAGLVWVAPATRTAGAAVRGIRVHGATISNKRAPDLCQRGFIHDADAAKQGEPLATALDNALIE